MYIICIIDYYESFNITNYEGFELNDIHYKYNFILRSGKIDITVSFNKDDSYFVISGIYPSTLDFTKTDSINISILTDNTKKIKNIGLNKARTDLECKGENDLKTCIVPKSHFDGAKSGYYFFHSINAENEDRISYESFGTNDILPEKKDSKGSVISTPFFLLVLLNLILL